MQTKKNLFKIRNSTKNDEKLILDWANEKAVRQNSFNTNYINEEDHRKWFFNMLNNSNFTQYIMTDLNDKPIGQVRFKIKGSLSFIDVSIDSYFRGKGLGSVLLRKSFAKYFLENRTKYLLIAEVKEINLPSISLFSSLKFNSKEYDKKMKTYKFTFDFNNEKFIEYLNNQ